LSILWQNHTRRGPHEAIPFLRKGKATLVRSPAWGTKKLLGDEMPSTIDYIPGACNIGPAEIRLRKITGILGSVLMIVLLIVFNVLDVPSAWKLLIFIPATISANGFSQAEIHFCALFEIFGVFNFGSKLGKTNAGKYMDYRKQDQVKAIQVIMFSMLNGFLVAMVGYYL
jgi:hypothetical protein